MQVQTFAQREKERYLNKAHRQKKFHARQTHRQRPAAWQHSCLRVVGEHMRRHLDRIDSAGAIIQDQLASVGETLDIGFIPRRTPIVLHSRDVSVLVTNDSSSGVDELIRREMPSGISYGKRLFLND